MLNNIIKHAPATKAEVQLIEHKQNLILMVHENGKRRSQPLDKLLSHGFGFSNIQSRVKSMDGKMEIDSTIGGGTTITIEIPFEKTY